MTVLTDAAGRPTRARLRRREYTTHRPADPRLSVAEALKVGYRHIDAALVYGNQNEVGAGIRASGVPRSEITVVSKLWNNSHRPELVEADLDLTLRELSLDYLDVYLIHWPVPYAPGADLFPQDKAGDMAIDWAAPSIADTWAELVRLYRTTNKVRAIGVSNFTVAHLEAIIAATGVVPAVNQVECHPSLIQPELFEYCRQKRIVITAYSPLGNNITGKARVIDSDVVKEVAAEVGKEPAQVLIAWATRNGFAVIPKSVTPARIKVGLPGEGRG